jgi:tRNA (guanine-N7-)-methyltransferase
VWLPFATQSFAKLAPFGVRAFFIFLSLLSVERMPRRQLRAIDPRIDLSAVLRTVEQLPETVTAENLFGDARPLELEIGSGKGLFLEQVTAKRPEHHFLGVEIAAARLARAERSNGMVVSGDAEPILANRIPDESLTAVHIYFPDPWWKKKHKKRRVINPSSAGNIYRTLKPGGTFHFWTDVLEYFETALSMIGEHFPQFGVPIPEESAAALHDLDYRTHFERRSRQHAIPVYRIRFEKR